MEALPDDGKPAGQQGYQEGMRLTADSPSWMWKSLRRHMASQPGTNKAGRKVGKGTISKERREKRKHLQAGHDGGDGHGGGGDGGGNSWEREGWWSNSWERGYNSNSWERGTHYNSYSWERDWRDDGWWGGWGTGGSSSNDDDQWPELPPVRRKRSPSPSQSPSPRHRPPVWRKKKVAPEAEAARKQWLDDHALQPIKEQKEEKPPLEKGDGAAASAEKPRLEKGAMEMKEEPPLKKGDGAAASSAGQPLQKGDESTMVWPVNNEIPPANHEAILRLLDAGCKVAVCSWRR